MKVIEHVITYTQQSTSHDGSRVEVGGLPSPGPTSTGKGKEITGAMTATAINNLKKILGNMMSKHCGKKRHYCRICRCALALIFLR